MGRRESNTGTQKEKGGRGREGKEGGEEGGGGGGRDRDRDRVRVRDRDNKEGERGGGGREGSIGTGMQKKGKTMGWRPGKRQGTRRIAVNNKKKEGPRQTMIAWRERTRSLRLKYLQ